jgi:hypothetical protein
MQTFSKKGAHDQMAQFTSCMAEAPEHIIVVSDSLMICISTTTSMNLVNDRVQERRLQHQVDHKQIRTPYKPTWLLRHACTYDDPTPVFSTRRGIRTKLVIRARWRKSWPSSLTLETHLPTTWAWWRRTHSSDAPSDYSDSTCLVGNGY